MEITYIILNTLSVGQIVIDKTYLDVYRLIDQTAQAFGKIHGLSGIDVYNRFYAIEKVTFGAWTWCRQATADDNKTLDQYDY